MLYTPGQFTSALGLSKQQWRTFKKFLVCLSPGSGHAPSLSAGQLLATRVVQFVADRLQAPLIIFTPLSDDLFRLCESAPWPQLERSKMIIDFSRNAVEVAPVDQSLGHSPIAIIVELRPLIVDLREKLLEVDIDQQASLAFPPMIAGRRK